MALDTNFNVNPYNDDFDEDKKYLRMLFKPGYAIQARELTQAQTLLQKQIERFGNSIFKNGSVVTGGQQTLQDATYINVASTYASTDVVANNFVGQTIFNSDDSKRAEVLAVYNADTTNNEPITIMVKQVYGDAFTVGETIKTSETSPYLANIADSNAIGTGQVFSVSEGVYYYDGFFVKTDSQTVAVNKYRNTTGANAKIGFEVTESVVSYTSDTTLLDPAQDASNYQAPGSDRFKMELILAKRSLESTDTTKFIEVARVENGVLTKSYQYPVYSVLEDNLARRTYDESGNYTVRPFNISLDTDSSNANNMLVTLSPGKAYVYGYEFETIAPTTITVPKPRDSEDAVNKRLTADYGHFVYTNNHYGSLPINSLTTVDLHCVPTASINVTSSATITNTKIGTARVKSVSFDSASNTSNSSTYEYKTYLFDVSVGSITGTIKTANTGNVTIGNVTAGQIYSGVNDAYKGAKLRITSGPGSTEGAKFITGFDGVNQVITLADNFITVPNSTSQFSIDFEFNDVDSIANFTGTTKNLSVDIDERSKDLASDYDDAVISDVSFEPLIFNLGQEYIKPQLSDFSYTYKKMFVGQSFGATTSPLLALETGANLVSSTSSTDRAEKYQVIVTSAGTSPYTVGQTIPADKITSVDPIGKTISVENANTMTANIIATVYYTKESGSAAVPKTLVTANATVQTSGGTSLNTNGVIVYAGEGQTTIEANNVIRTPDTRQSLYVSDVIELVSVYDYSNTAVSNTGYTDITSHYTLDNGQRNSFYDHASIKLKPGYAAPVGPLVVRFNAYSSNTSGFFSVDSYPTYDTIPTFTSPTTGVKYDLRDCLDFRPVRTNATTSVSFNIGAEGSKIPKGGSDIILDYSYYLPRKDRIVLNKSKTFEVLQGKPSLNPVEPANKEDSMTLYNLTEPAWVADTNDITVNYVNNRRYTMKDIGSIDKRVENLEYYTSLSLLEQDAVNKQDLTILDSTNLPRFKNGIVVDAFKGHSVADITNLDYKASIDPTKQEMRPSFNVFSRGLTFNAGSSTNFSKTGPFVTVASSNTSFINQPMASKSVNVNPFNVVNYIGKIKLDPPSDTWVDTTVKPDVLVNIGGDKDAWDLLLNTRGVGLTSGGFSIRNAGSGYTYGATVTISGGGGSGATATVLYQFGEILGIEIVNPGSGYTFPPTVSISRPYDSYGIQAQAEYSPAAFPSTFNYEWGNWNTNWTGTTVTAAYNYRSSQTTVSQVQNQYTTSGQTRQGIVSQVVPETITQSLGDRVVDVSIVPFMREKGVLFVGSDFKPSTTLYPFFDTVAVEKYTARANKFVLASNNLGYNVNIGNAETLEIKDTANNSTNGTCLGVATSNNMLFVVNVDPTTAFNATSQTLRGTKSNTTVTITSYEHYSGRVQSANTANVTLRVDANGAANEAWYANTSNNSLITIVSGTGAGQQRTMSAYNAATRIATVSSAWDTVPDTTSIYSIGRLTSTPSGTVAGVFQIPRATFRVGEKLFRLIDTSTGDIPSSSTNGDATFYAQGLLQTTEQTILSTIAPVIQRTSVKDSRVVSSNRIVNVGVVAYVDPLAQTFLVSPQNYSQGVFIEKVRFCFKSKDETVPITLQVRPTVNGYPSATTIYPYGSVTLTPDQVNVSDSPNLDEEGKYTDFVFDVPLYVQPGEHSFALVANCNKYESYIGTIGELDLVTGKQISEQPYGGSLFLSQNGSTWTADQNSDIMFRVYRKVFDTTTPAEAYFVIDSPDAGANVVYDLAQVITSQVSLANTSVSYSFASEKESGGMTSYLPINQLTDYEMSDGHGRRVLNPATGNSTFVLKATISTLDPQISPFLDTSRFSAILVDNTLNNMPLENSAFTIVNGGTGYANSADVTVTVSPPGGVGTQAEAAAVVTSNVITSVYLTAAGSGYTTSPTITITPGSGGGSGASVIYNGEDKKSGGNGAVRYITRRVTLADGFDSGDLRVYLTGYKPAGSNILVYYKLLSNSDNDTFDNKEWHLMTELGNSGFVSTNKSDYRELTFAPGTSGVANNSVVYTSGSTAYNTFRTFAVKVVLAGTDTTDVPKVRDLRVIALPPGA